VQGGAGAPSGGTPASLLERRIAAGLSNMLWCSQVQSVVLEVPPLVPGVRRLCEEALLQHEEVNAEHVLREPYVARADSGCRDPMSQCQLSTCSLLVEQVQGRLAESCCVGNSHVQIVRIRPFSGLLCARAAGGIDRRILNPLLLRCSCCTLALFRFLFIREQAGHQLLLRIEPWAIARLR